MGCQWQFNGAAISSATATSYLLPSAQSTDAGSYSVVVTNSVGSVTSAVATLIVLVPPSISAQPQDQSVLVGNCGTFSVTADGTAPLYYQWQWNGVPQAGGTALSSSTWCNAGSCSVVITNAAGSVTSAVATLTLLVPASIATQPASLIVTQNQNATFNVTPAGTAPLSCQWQFNSVPIAGATATGYTVTNAQSSDAGSYSVLVTNNWGSATSTVATLTVLVPPSITVQPQSQTISTGTCATFCVTAAGTAPLFYQWQWNGAPQAGGTNLTSYIAYNAGSYSVLVSNVAGVVLSDTATLSFTNPAPPLGGQFDSLASSKTARSS